MNRYLANISSCLFTLASLARLGGRIHLSCNVVHIGFPFNLVSYSIDDILHGALKDRRTIRRGSIFGELHDRYAMNSSSNNTHGPGLLSMPHQCLASPRRCMKNPSLIVRGANTSCYPGGSGISFLNRPSRVGRAGRDLRCGQ